MTCAICDKPATQRWSPDLDIHGMGSCEDHREEVRIVYFMLILGPEKEAKKMLKQFRKEAMKSAVVPSDVQRCSGEREP